MVAFIIMVFLLGFLVGAVYQGMKDQEVRIADERQ